MASRKPKETRTENCNIVNKDLTLKAKAKDLALKHKLKECFSKVIILDIYYAKWDWKQQFTQV